MKTVDTCGDLQLVECSKEEHDEIMATIADGRKRYAVLNPCWFLSCYKEAGHEKRGDIAHGHPRKADA